MRSKTTKKNAVKVHIPGTSRADEEQYLADTIEVAQKNLDRANESIVKLKEEVDALMEEVNSTGEKDNLFLWNNARAQLRETVGEIARYEKARKKPYFGRIDFSDALGKQEESYYIGRVGIARQTKEPAVIDWRTPVASVYYENAMGRGTYTVSAEGTFEIDLKRKRSYEIESDRLVDFYDLDVVANDELLTKYLSKNKTEVLGEIIATIQKEQNRIIRRSPKTNMIVQGVAGSGKTTVAMHRISYILYNYEKDFKPEDFYIIGSNRILLNYITSVLPELDVYGVRQMTMEQLFIRLLYEDWDGARYSYHSLNKNDDRNCVKGGGKWFRELERFCNDYEESQISHDEVYMEKTGNLLLGRVLIDTYLKENPLMSMQSKCLMLNEILYSKYENEILGKHVSFTPEEKKELEKKYRTYYGRDDWKGSIYEVYHSFLTKQAGNGYDIDIPENSFDVYDLAALAYIYKRIKEIDPVREATHVVIDEAQDFGMMAYCCLHYCMRRCTYTIMGDTSQNIHFQYGLNDWDELRKLVLSGPYDKFGLLRKSYRNTVEISDFATEILRHGDFSIYPVEPIIRHGNEVRVEKIGDGDGIIKEAANTISSWQKQGYETIAVICRDEEEAAEVAGKIAQYITIKDVDLESAEFGSGVMVLPVAYTKGLEFDAVLIFDPSEEKYPSDNGHVKMLYVTATRALHELTVLYRENLTRLLSEKAPEGKHMEEFESDALSEADDVKRKQPTQKEIIEQQKIDGSREMAMRSYIGPKRIEIKPSQIVDNDKNTSVHKIIEPAVKKNAVKNTAADDCPVNTSKYAYGEMPENQALMVKGHAKPDVAVRWVKKTKSCVEIASRYGLLILTPVTEQCVRVSFVKGQLTKLQDSYWKSEPESGLKWSAKESPSVIEIVTAQLTIHIEKKDGAIRFMSPDKKVLLSEKAGDPRMIEGQETWNFFEFEKKERLRSKGILADSLSELSQKARYISFGGRRMRMPLILSGKGYAIGVAAEKTVMFCGISTYGQYLYTEGSGQIDYFFLNGGSEQKNIELCKNLKLC